MTTHSVNRILANNTNAVREAVISATAQRASTEIRLLGQSRQGRGRMTLTGPYSGADDTLIDVEILPDAGATSRASTPIITGIGNGTLTATSIDAGAVAETLVFTLDDAGDPATYAALSFYGATLRAKSAGAAGNALALTVTRNLTLTDTKYSLIDQISAGTAAFTGSQWDFGAVAATSAGIPSGAPRLLFEGFPQIHRHWKTWESGAWYYHLDPTPAWNIPEDVVVKAVTGGYTLALTDGVTTETYTATTIYEFLSAVQARSALIDVIGVVSADTAPGGMAVTDIPLRTDAHAMPVEASLKGQYAKRYLAGVAVAAEAPTENIRITCQGGGANAETWSVSGPVSGSLGTAATGRAFASDACAFTIPEADIPDGARALISAKSSLASRSGEEASPFICFSPLKRGKLATAKTITFVYTKRPDSSCDCASMPALSVSDACLGMTSAGGGMALATEYQTRLSALYTWRSTFMRAQADFAALAGIKLAVTDMDFCDAAVDSFATTLEQIYSTAAARTEWDSAFTQLQSDFSAIGAGANVPITQTDIAAAKVGDTVVNPLTGHVYRLEAIEKVELRYSGGSVSYAVSALSAAPVLAGWGTSGATTTIQTPTSGDFSADTTPVGFVKTREDSTWKDLGAAVDLLSPRSALDVQQLNRRYAARMDYVLTLAGIVPKSDASGGDGCWRDRGGAYWWEESTGRYLPAFTNQPYVSCVMRDGVPASTQEFGFGLVVGCEGALKAGDSITITIDGASSLGYAEGDYFVLPIVGAQAASFTGGEDGDATQTWTVSGSVSGAFADWSWNPESPTPYTAGPANCTLSAGGIPFEPGDRISLTIDAGQLRWRRDGGAWTSADLFAADGHALGDGLTLTPAPGAAPSFVSGDTWSFRASATHGLDQLRQPREGRAFAWDGGAVSLAIDLGAVVPLEAVLLAMHSLSAQAVITINGGDAAANEWTLEPAWRSGPILAVTAPGATARYLAVEIIGAGDDGAEIGWLWAGVPWAPTTGASSIQHIRQYGLSRTAGRNPSALYRGRGTGGRWSWALSSEAALLEADVAGLLALLDHVAEQGLEWVCLVPDIRNPAGATLAQIDADEATLTENLGWSHDDSPLYDVDLPFRAVLG